MPPELASALTARPPQDLERKDSFSSPPLRHLGSAADDTAMKDDQRRWDTEVDRNIWRTRYELLRGDTGWLLAVAVAVGMVLGVCLTRLWWGR
jgi:hypothetical protein